MGTSGAMSTSNQYVKYSITISTNWQSIGENYSSINVKVNFWRTNSGYSTYGSGTCYCKINGTTYSASVSTSQKITSSGITLFNRDVAVPHSADGSKYLDTSAWISLNTPLSSDEQWYGEWLSTIPRASSISSISGNTFGEEVTVNISRASNSFTHIVGYMRPDGEWFRVGENIEASCTFTPALSDCNYVPNSTQASAQIGLDTYYGGTWIGYTRKDFTLYVPSNVVPTIDSITLTESTAGILSKFGGFVQGKSKIKATISASGIYNSTIQKYQSNINNQTFSSSEFTTNELVGSGSQSVTTTVTDSRGRTANKTINFQVLPYESPTINIFSVIRCDQNGTENDEGAYAKCTFKAGISSVNNRNDKTFELLYKKLTDSNYTTINLSDTDYSYESSQIIAADINSEYEFTFKVTDYFGSVEKSLNLGTAFTLMDFNTNGRSLAFGRVSTASTNEKKIQIKLDTEIEGNFKLGGKTIFDLIYPIGSIYMSVDPESPQILFGGTWEQIQDRFLLSVGSKYSVGVTGGSETHVHTTGNHKLTIDEIPSHTHGYRNAADESDSDIWCYINSYRKGTTGYVNYTGGDGAHNHGNTSESSNLPPYLAVYMWKRTA